jgi:site-specific DNA-methyltransferase (adenine-specific)
MPSQAKPYYENDGITLYHGDCLEVDAWLAADVLVTDPPYGVGYVSNMNRNRRNTKLGRPIASDATTEARDSALAAWDGPAVVFGRWDTERPTGVHTRLIWDKGGGFMGNLKLPWGRSDEEIYVIGSGFTGRREGSVLRVHMLMSADSERPDHPTPKPVPLMERLIEKCPPGVVADPFTGSGSTLIAARNLGRKAIGVEIEERYCEVIARRLDQMCFDFEACDAVPG